VFALSDGFGSFALSSMCEMLLREIEKVSHSDVKVAAMFCLYTIDDVNVDTVGYLEGLRLRIRNNSLWSCSSFSCTNVMSSLWTDKYKECSLCHVPRYCSTACQKTHWRLSHRHICKEIKSRKKFGQ